MSVESAVLAGRTLAESLMLSTCVITRDGVPVQNADGSLTSTQTTVYSGVCGWRYPFVRPEDVVAEGQQLAKVRGVLSLPVSAAGSGDVAADDVAVVTVGDLDPGTVLRVRVEVPFTQTRMTARRFPGEVLS